jgi:hypothetical protein
MRYQSGLAALLGLASAASAQTLGFVHRTIPADSGVPRSIALGDVDGDGDLDAFAGMGETCAGRQDRLYRNGGAGVFADGSATNLSALLDSTFAVALGDVDGDGDLDAFLGNGGPAGGQDRLYLNGGAGVYTDVTATSLPALLADTTAVALGDVDGDGDLDAWIGGLPNRLLVNDGAGHFADVSATNLPALLDSTLAVALGDVDADGDLDAFLGTSSQSRLYLNDGTGVFADGSATNLPVLLDITRAAAFGDVDGDGDLDVYAGNFFQQDRLLLNDGAGTFTDATGTNLPAFVSATASIAMGDVDGDGDFDAFVGTSFQQYRLLLNDGTGAFTDATTSSLPALAGETPAVALGDVDGDVDLDALAGNTGLSGQDRLYLNDGRGVFADATATSLPPLVDLTQAVALGDVDGDGDLDAFVGNLLQQDRLLLNDGAGAFTDVTATNLPASSSATTSVALGDVDGDGDLDAFVGNYGQEDLLYLNGGTGVFTDVTATNLPALSDNTHAVALGDVDGDGDLDAFVGNFGQNRLYLNGGTGVFTDVTATNLPGLFGVTAAVALGDVDGDGDLDAFVGKYGQQDLLYLNGGTGVFADVTATNLPALLDNTRALALGDVDGDGDLDAFVGNYGQQDRLYLNGGTGVFTDVTATNLPALSDETMAIALGDVDVDGDLDAFVGNFGQNRLYTNLTRQLAWRGIPRIGKPLTLDLHGPSWGAWFLAFSTGTASLPIPPFGTLRLDPANVNLVFASLLDAAGRASITFPVPANPILLGVPVYWQAVVASPERLTNLEITTATAL